MNPEDILPPNPKTHVANNLSVTQPGERTLSVIKRHPIGILGVYAMCALVLVVTAILAFVVLPGISSNNTRQVVLVGALVFVLVAAVCVTFALIAARVYWGNNWTLTTDSLTQVLQVSLFRRQSSQLSLADLEDVTVEQNGMLAQALNYGVLRVETAGERSKFMFPYCPNPNYYAKQILAAREAFEQNRRIEEGPHPSALGYQAPSPAEAPPAPMAAPMRFTPAPSFSQQSPQLPAEAILSPQISQFMPPAAPTQAQPAPQSPAPEYQPLPPRPPVQQPEAGTYDPGANGGIQ